MDHVLMDVMGAARNDGLDLNWRSNHENSMTALLARKLDLRVSTGGNDRYGSGSTLSLALMWPGARNFFAYSETRRGYGPSEDGAPHDPREYVVWLLRRHLRIAESEPMRVLTDLVSLLDPGIKEAASIHTGLAARGGCFQIRWIPSSGGGPQEEVDLRIFDNGEALLWKIPYSGEPVQRLEATPEGLRDALRGVPLNSRDFRSVVSQR